MTMPFSQGLKIPNSHPQKGCLFFGGATPRRSYSRAVSLDTLASGAPYLSVAECVGNLRRALREKQHSVVFLLLQIRTLSATGGAVQIGWSVPTKQKHPSNEGCICLEAPPGFEPGDRGFADLCLTAWPWRRSIYAILL